MSNKCISLYDASNIDLLPWPETEEAHYAKKFLVPLLKEGIEHFVENIRTELLVLLFDDMVIPITVNDKQYENAYVCSPYGMYICCAIEAVSHRAHPWLKPPLNLILRALSQTLRYGNINKIVIVNNWLISTILYQKFSNEQVQMITQFLTKRFPDHAIAFRSVHTHEKRNVSMPFRTNRFTLIASRHVYFLDTSNEDIFKARIFKSDFKLLRETNYKIQQPTQLQPEELQRITSLYRTIYIERHSKFHPALTPRWFQLLLDSQLLNITTIRNQDASGSIDAVVGQWSRDGIMTAPLLGYDPTKQNQLYRLSCTVLTQQAREKKALFHLGAGGTFFKKIRRGEGCLEYMAVYHQHLPWLRRIPWWILKGVINGLGIPFMKRYK